MKITKAQNTKHTIKVHGTKHEIKMRTQYSTKESIPRSVDWRKVWQKIDLDDQAILNLSNSQNTSIKVGKEVFQLGEFGPIVPLKSESVKPLFSINEFSKVQNNHKLNWINIYKSIFQLQSFRVGSLEIETKVGNFLDRFEKTLSHKNKYLKKKEIILIGNEVLELLVFISKELTQHEQEKNLLTIIQREENWPNAEYCFRFKAASIPDRQARKNEREALCKKVLQALFEELEMK